MTKHERLFLIAACLLALAMWTGATLGGAACLIGVGVLARKAVKVQALTGEVVRVFL